MKDRVFSKNRSFNQPSGIFRPILLIEEYSKKTSMNLDPAHNALTIF
jgi:hypothetical protein